LADWPGVRVVKACLGSLIAAALIVMWAQRDVVGAAYANEGRSSTVVQLGGVDLTVELTPIDESPYQVLAAPDTRRVAIADIFDSEVAEAELLDQPGVAGEAAPDGSTPTPPSSRPNTVSPLPIYGGTAELSGTVTGPDGPVPFATVRIQRHTSDGVVAKDLVTDSSGRWTTARLLGGRYRIWAWASHDGLAMAGSELFFLDSGEQRRFDLVVDEIDTDPRVALTDAGSIYVGLRGTVAISVTARSVDADGRVLVAGLPGTVVTFDPSHGVATSPPVAVTDADGVARFTIECLTQSRPIVHVRHSADVREDPDDPEKVHVFALPACIPIPPPPPPTTAPPTGPPATDPGTVVPDPATPGGSTDE